jgi:hypothetical protein
MVGDPGSEAGMTGEGSGVTGSGSGMTGLGVGWEKYRIRFRDDTDQALGWERLSGRRSLGGGIATSGSLPLEFIKPHDENSRPEGRSHLSRGQALACAIPAGALPIFVIPAAALPFLVIPAGAAPFLVIPAGA